MRKYNGLWTLARCMLPIAAISALAAGCANTGKKESYPLNVPAQPAERPDGAFRRGAGAGGAEEPIVRSDAPMQYTVKKGDTLWDIAGRFLENPWEWPEIWVANRQVKNPHLIYPGDQLTLIWVNGRPQIMLGDASGRLSPSIRSSSLEDAIPTIPIDAIRAFLVGPRLVTLEEIRSAPYVLDFLDMHMMAGLGHQVYLKNVPADGRTEYDIVHLGQRYVDPDSGRELGWEALPVSSVEIRQYGDPAVGVITSPTRRETLRGDHLLKPQPQSFDASFYPHAPRKLVNATIIAVYDGVTNIGQFQVITLNRGAIDGLEPGHVLSVQQANRVSVDPYTSKHIKLPEAYAGRVMVFKTETRVSFALVMSAVRSIHLYDKAEKPKASDR